MEDHIFPKDYYENLGNLLYTSHYVSRKHYISKSCLAFSIRCRFAHSLMPSLILSCRPSFSHALSFYIAQVYPIPCSAAFLLGELVDANNRSEAAQSIVRLFMNKGTIVHLLRYVDEKTVDRWGSSLSIQFITRFPYSHNPGLWEKTKFAIRKTRRFSFAVIPLPPNVSTSL